MLKRLIRNACAAMGFEIRRIENRRNIYVDKPAWDYQSSYVLPHYNEGDLVIDIGCGGAPAPIANVLTDYFPDHSIHRARPVIEDRPLVVCSADRMPFRNKSFDLSICAHVLEHVHDPRAAADEIARVSKRGYLETPAYGKDILVGTGHQHVWQVVSDGKTFHFFPYTARQHEAHQNSPLMSIWCQEKFHDWQLFFWARQDLFNAIQFWEEAPRIEVHSAVADSSQILEWRETPPSKLPTTPAELTESEIHLLESSLVSPDRKESMRFDGARFVNPRGNISYPVRGKRIYFELGEV